MRKINVFILFIVIYVLYWTRQCKWKRAYKTKIVWNARSWIMCYSSLVLLPIYNNDSALHIKRTIFDYHHLWVKYVQKEEKNKNWCFLEIENIERKILSFLIRLRVMLPWKAIISSFFSSLLSIPCEGQRCWQAARVRNLLALPLQPP